MPMPYIAVTFADAGIFTAVTCLRADSASVAYTNATSASPVATAFRVAVASTPREMFDSDSVTPVRDKTADAYTPHGTVFAHKETTAAFFKSFTEEILNGFPGFTTICIELRANTRGDRVMFPLAKSLSKLVKSAAAKTSVGAPA